MSITGTLEHTPPLFPRFVNFKTMEAIIPPEYYLPIDLETAQSFLSFLRLSPYFYDPAPRPPNTDTLEEYKLALREMILSITSTPEGSDINTKYNPNVAILMLFPNPLPNTNGLGEVVLPIDENIRVAQIPKRIIEHYFDQLPENIREALREYQSEFFWIISFRKE